MKCPICKTEVKFGEAFMPFCSERCKLLDLGAWSSEEYVISTPLQPGEGRTATLPSDTDDDER